VILNRRGVVVGIRSALLDYTSRAQAEQSLRRIRDDLKQRVYKRTAELAAANEALHKEIAERSRGEQRMALQYAVARILADSGGTASAGPRMLQAISEHLGWDLGIFWAMNPATGVLECQATWRADDAPAGMDPEKLLPIEGGLAGWVSVTREAC